MQKEPNWSAFYTQLQKLGPLMLKGVPGEYKWWVEETAVDTDKFGKFTQERFYTYWCWSETLENRRDAVLETLKQWASNVKRELYYILEIYEESSQKCERLRSQVANIRLEPKVGLLKNLLECALQDKYTKKKILTNKGYVLVPNAFILAWTHEKIVLLNRSRIAARVEGKSSLARLGLAVHVTAPTIHAGFEGHLQLELCNHGLFSIRLTPGMPICQLIFEMTLGTPDKGYSGKFLRQQK